jgi:uridylate kinase
MKQRVVHLKQSGELLTDVKGERWTATALKKAAARIAEVQAQAKNLNIAGLLVVPGGGNATDGFGRGAAIRAQFGEDSAVAKYADVIGRRSTVDNAIMLAAALKDAGVPHEIFAAPNSLFEDIELGEIKAYDVELVQVAFHEGKVVLMAGGSGKGGQTTDAAVLEYSLWQAAAHPELESVALKATKFNGVYDDDPAKNQGARRYADISASTMLADYERFCAVDEVCLKLLQEAGAKGIDARLQVYDATFSIVAALKDQTLGTMVHAKDVADVFASK